MLCILRWTRAAPVNGDSRLPEPPLRHRPQIASSSDALCTLHVPPLPLDVRAWRSACRYSGYTILVSLVWLYTSLLRLLSAFTRSNDD